MPEIEVKQWPKDVPEPETKPELRLSKNDGNAFSIIGRALRAARKSGWTEAQMGAFQDICMSGNYDNVLQTCIKYFDVR